MSIPEALTALKAELMQSLVPQLLELLSTAIRDGTPVHQVESALWDLALQLGRRSLTALFTACGRGDGGPALTLPDGREVHRLEQCHRRRYVSIFGAFELERVVYGSRQGQAIEFVPLDNRLQLPASAFSYVLQDWDQALCVEQAFGQAGTTIQRMLGLKQSVDSLEHMNQEMAQEVTTFMLNRPQPAVEGEVVVASADQKGIVVRRSADDPPPKAHRTKGDKASRKRMATVATVYTVDRYRRTPEEVVAALFRDAPEPSRD